MSMLNWRPCRIQTRKQPESTVSEQDPLTTPAASEASPIPDQRAAVTVLFWKSGATGAVAAVCAWLLVLVRAPWTPLAGIVGGFALLAFAVMVFANLIVARQYGLPPPLALTLNVVAVVGVISGIVALVLPVWG